MHPDTPKTLIPNPPNPHPHPSQVSKFDDPHEACLSVVAESYRLWLQHEIRTDDITMVVCHFQGLENEAPAVHLPTPLG